MDIIRRRNNSPEARRLIEQRNALSRPGTLRCRYDHQTQRAVFAPSRPNKRSREEIAEIDPEIMRRANRLGGGYLPIQEEPEENTKEGEINQEPEDTEEDSIILRGDNLPIVDLSKYNTDGKEAKYIQINHIVGKLTSNKKITEENIKKAEFEFMMDLKTLISKTATVMRFTVHTGVTKIPFELHHGRKPRTDLTNIVKDVKPFYLIGQNYLLQHQ